MSASPGVLTLGSQFLSRRASAVRFSVEVIIVGPLTSPTEQLFTNRIYKSIYFFFLGAGIICGAFGSILYLVLSELLRVNRLESALPLSFPIATGVSVTQGSSKTSRAYSHSVWSDVALGVCFRRVGCTARALPSRADSGYTVCWLRFRYAYYSASVSLDSMHAQTVSLFCVSYIGLG